MDSMGQRLKRAREKKGLFQRVVAEKLGVAIGTLSGYERDYRDPDTETLIKMAEMYDVSMDWIAGRVKDTRTLLSPGERDLIDSVSKVVDVENEEEIEEALSAFEFKYKGKDVPSHYNATVFKLLRTLLENDPNLQGKKK